MGKKYHAFDTASPSARALIYGTTGVVKKCGITRINVLCAEIVIEMLSGREGCT